MADMERAVAFATYAVGPDSSWRYHDVENLARAFLALLERNERLAEKWREESHYVADGPYDHGVNDALVRCASELEGK